MMVESLVLTKKSRSVGGVDLEEEIAIRGSLQGYEREGTEGSVEDCSFA